jgi:hypothetical protein
VSVDEVKRTIRLGNEAAEQGRDTLQRSLTEATEAGALAKAVLPGADDEHADQIVAKLDSLDREVELAVRRFEAATGHADAFVAAL